MLYELFVFGTFWFWLLLAAFVALEVLFDCIESGKAATAVAIVTLIIMQLFSNLNPLGWIGKHPAEFFGGVAGYVVFGAAVWGRLKWRFKVRQAFEDACQKIEGWLDSKGVTVNRVKGIPKIPAELVEDFKNWSRVTYGRDLRDPIRTRDNKAWYIRVSSCWVFNLIWTCTHDALNKMFTTLYNLLARTLQSDADRVFSSLKD